MAGLLQLKDQLTEDDVVVIVIHDHGSRYVGKIYNDDWMRERGFLDTELRVKDILARKNDKEFFFVNASETVRQAFAIMKEHDISQMPVLKDQEVVGSITENIVLSYLLDNPFNNSEKTVENIMGEPFPLVNPDMPFSQLNHYINKSTPAVLVRDAAGTMHVVTKYDIIQTL
jgi:cystathionine beta-synthase